MSRKAAGSSAPCLTIRTRPSCSRTKRRSTSPGGAVTSRGRDKPDTIRTVVRGASEALEIPSQMAACAVGDCRIATRSVRAARGAGRRDLMSVPRQDGASPTSRPVIGSRESLRHDRGRDNGLRSDLRSFRSESRRGRRGCRLRRPEMWRRGRECPCNGCGSRRSPAARRRRRGSRPPWPWRSEG